jgi:hypothetical protein
MLLVSGLQPPVPRVGRQGGVRVGEADLLVSAGLLAVPLGPSARYSRRLLPFRRRLGFRLVVLRKDCIRVSLAEALPRDIGADERRVDVDDLAPGDARLDAGPNRPGEYLSEQLGTPALPDAGERRVVG